MITHKLDDAIQYGNRLIMLHRGQMIMDVQHEHKKSLQISDLLHQFQSAQGDKDVL